MKRSAVAIVAVVICTVGLYTAFAQVADRKAEPDLTDGAIVVGKPGPGGVGRYQMEPYNTHGAWGVVVVDTQTGQVWYRDSGTQWKDWGSPVKQK